MVHHHCIERDMDGAFLDVDVAYFEREGRRMGLLRRAREVFRITVETVVGIESRASVDRQELAQSDGVA